MIQIISIAVLTGIVGIVLVWQVYKAVSKKLKKEAIDSRSSLLKIGTLGMVLVGLMVYNLYLISSNIIDNKDEILGYGQKAIAGTVTYGTTAVFEGLGHTIDHFEGKWDAEYSARLKKVDIEIKSFKRESMDESTDAFIVDLIVNNRNTDKEKLSLSYISDNNYMLVGDKDSIYYPLMIRKNQYNNLPTGKTGLTAEGVVPKDLDVKYFKLLDSVKEIK